MCADIRRRDLFQATLRLTGPNPTVAASKPNMVVRQGGVVDWRGPHEINIAGPAVPRRLVQFSAFELVYDRRETSTGSRS